MACGNVHAFPDIIVMIDTMQSYRWASKRSQTSKDQQPADAPCAEIAIHQDDLQRHLLLSRVLIDARAKRNRNVLAKRPMARYSLDA